MNVIEICKDVINNIDTNGNITGEVLSVYSGAFNVISEDDELISILSKEKSIAPNSILLKQKTDFIKLGIFKGMKIIISKDEIIIPDITLYIKNSKAKIWDSGKYRETKDISEDRLISKLQLLENLIYEFGNLDGIAPIIFNLERLNKDYKLYTKVDVGLNQYSSFIIERINIFLKILSRFEKYKLPFIVNRLVGFGPGLTPSVDDFIAGVMLSLEYSTGVYDLNEKKVRIINKKIFECSLGRTTKVSEEMLKHACVGKTTRFNKDFIISLLTDCDEKVLKDNFIKVINFGDTSGTDMVCGIYIGFRMLLNIKNRRVFTNEGKC